MKGEPTYPKSAPAATPAATAPPVPSAPDSATGPSNHSRTSLIKGKGLSVPAWPPAPQATRTRPSAPLATAFFAKAFVVTSWKTRPPYECTASLISGRAPSDVMTMGTSCLTQISMSSMSRPLDRCTIWFTANGASLGPSAALMSVIQASSTFSLSLPRALSAGKLPTMPALHCAITSAGFETMNNGAPSIGNRSCARSLVARLAIVLCRKWSICGQNPCCLSYQRAEWVAFVA
mmetsp:Transcript_5073/g.15026  ORF Transcript_5073/g.15026 Transcript_5073/m.15026 type:complete len:234 (-) Transcript_5073:858-1559(-)